MTSGTGVTQDLKQQEMHIGMGVHIPIIVMTLTKGSNSGRDCWVL